MEAAIEISGLEFAWAGHAPLLRIDDLRILRGERVFLSGASGSGKSTLLSLIGGVLQPQLGSVRVLGTSLSGMRQSERDRFRGEHLGFIFQMFNLIPYLSVRENVLLPLQFSPARRERLRDIAPEREAERLLSALELEGERFLDRSVLELSIGQQQRVAAARALIGRPDVLIADEPTSSLDVDARDGFLRLLMTECRLFAITALFVSHDRALGSYFDRAICLSSG